MKSYWNIVGPNLFNENDIKKLMHFSTYKVIRTLQLRMVTNFDKKTLLMYKPQKMCKMSHFVA